jgi:undecaprenyl diphosphate synthase
MPHTQSHTTTLLIIQPDGLTLQGTFRFMDLKAEIDLNRLPRHIAIIMDGNGRWAKRQGKPRIFGHQNAVKAVNDTVEACAELGIDYLTLYAFSTENWRRPKTEINALMTLLVETIKKEIKRLQDNDIKLCAIGDLENVPSKTGKALAGAIEQTRDNKRMTVVLALNYSSRWEIIEAVREIAKRAAGDLLRPDKIDQRVFESFLATKDIPDPELLIRTSGEYRISNFLLWQIAYAELYFTDVLWPDFRRHHLYQAIMDFQNRERRFGRISEQLA